ncbi:MAG: polysaccharide deacetylase family protein [Verrucomicrobiota bacterium]
MNASMLTRVARAGVRLGYHGLLNRHFLKSALAGKVTILLYHRIAEHDEDPWLEECGVPYTPPSIFQKHLEMLLSVKGQVLTMDELLCVPGNVSRPRFVISFDDGFADNFTTARSILEKYGLRGLFFIATSLPNKHRLWDHRLSWLHGQPPARAKMESMLRAWLPKPMARHNALWCLRHLLPPQEIERMLDTLEGEFSPFPQSIAEKIYGSWEQIRDTANAGHQIGAHTVHHWMRHTIGLESFRSELLASKAELEKQLARQVTAFSYPYNSYLFTDVELCREVGFTQIFTVDPGRFAPGTLQDTVPRRTVFSVHDSLPRFSQLLLD